MPELPEVETVINILKPLVVNKTISDDKINIFSIIYLTHIVEY